ncbi:copper resistance D family protein [Paenibacillus sp. L3-i20]|uniref:copper resistance D family protein n=1 Tax=Paenibacillus sp. L3-i20 TaxID=2905833 RepID=UPI001EDE7EC0|nr:CopD family protein [Paenibacillus sp. L3-i20]GKU80428.1 hypothetical protein L3i20_v248250 [Paenibacillus sp. L3-i20]
MKKRYVYISILVMLWACLPGFVSADAYYGFEMEGEGIALGASAESLDESQEHDHSGGQRLMVVLRIWDVVAGILLGASLFFRYVLWRDKEAKSPKGFTLGAERIVMIVAALIWFASGCYRINMLVEQFGGIPWSTIVTSTMVGHVALLRPAAAILIFILAFAPQRDGIWANPLKIGIAVVTVVTFPLTGHAYASISEGGAAIVAHCIHMAAAVIWVGGLAGIWSLTYDRNSIEQLHVTAERFSKWAVSSIVVIVISGIWLTADQLTALEQLWKSEYGKLALAKSILLLLIVGIAALHRKLRSAAQGTRALIIGVRAEIVMAVGLIVLAGWLSTTSPPPQVSATPGMEPIYWHVMGEKAHMTLRVDPKDDSDVQVVRLSVWLPENLEAPQTVNVALIKDGGGSSNKASTSKVVMPVQPVPLQNEPYSFPGFTKYNYEGEGTFFTAADTGMLTVDVTDSTGETHHFERSSKKE